MNRRSLNLLSCRMLQQFHQPKTFTSGVEFKLKVLLNGVDSSSLLASMLSSPTCRGSQHPMAFDFFHVCFYLYHILHLLLMQHSHFLCFAHSFLLHESLFSLVATKAQRPSPAHHSRFGDMDKRQGLEPQ